MQIVSTGDNLNVKTYFLGKIRKKVFLCIGDNLHEMSNPVSGKNKKNISMLSAENFTQSAKH